MARGKKTPYPALGTPLGDMVVGSCEIEGCRAPVRRGSRFSTRVNGMPEGMLVCQECNESGK